MPSGGATTIPPSRSPGRDILFDAIIFDMDGVLVDSEPLHFATTNSVLGRRGVELDQAGYDACLGLDEVAFFAGLCARFGLAEPAEVLARERIAESLARLASEPLPPLPGVLELILGLAGEGRPLGLASSAGAAQVELVLGRLGLRRCFGATVSKDEVRAGKPAPDLYLEASRRLGVPPSACLAIEDAVHGVASARAAGMTVLALIPAGGSGDEHRAAGARACRRGLAGCSVDELDGLWSPPALPRQP